MTPTRRSARVAKKAAPASTAKTAKKRGGAKTDLDAIPEVIMMDGDGQGEDDEIADSEAPRTATKMAGGHGGKNKDKGDTKGKQKDDSADAATVVDLSELAEENEAHVEEVEVMPVAKTDTASADDKPPRGRKSIAKATPAKEKKSKSLADNAFATPSGKDASSEVSPLATRSSRKLRKSVAATSPAKSLNNEAESFVTSSRKQKNGANIGAENFVPKKDAEEQETLLPTNKEASELPLISPPFPATPPAKKDRKRSNSINMQQTSATKPDITQEVAKEALAPITGSSMSSKSPSKSAKTKNHRLKTADVEVEQKSNDRELSSSANPEKTAEKSENISYTEEVEKHTASPTTGSPSQAKSPPKSMTKKNQLKSIDVTVEQNQEEGEASPSATPKKVVNVDTKGVTLVQRPTAEMSNNVATMEQTTSPLSVSPSHPKSPTSAKKKKKKKQREPVDTQMEQTPKNIEVNASAISKNEVITEVEPEESTLSEQPFGSAKKKKKNTEEHCSPRRSDAIITEQYSEEHTPLAPLGKAEATKSTKRKKKRGKSLGQIQQVEGSKPIQNEELEVRCGKELVDEWEPNSETVVNPGEKAKKIKRRKKRSKSDVADTVPNKNEHATVPKQDSKDDGEENDLVLKSKAGGVDGTVPIEQLCKRKRKKARRTLQSALPSETTSLSSDAAHLINASESSKLNHSKKIKTSGASPENHAVDQTPSSELTGEPTKQNQSKIANKRIQSMLQVADSNPTENSERVIDVFVHRMRFLKLNLRPIIAMASTPWSPRRLSSGDSHQEDQLCNIHSQRLAISREGGSVELLNTKERWISVGSVPGVRGREVDALVWVCSKSSPTSITVQERSFESSKLNVLDRHELIRYEDEHRRLIGCSRDGTIFELDFATKRQKNVIGSGGGGVFCLSSLYSRGNCDNESAGYFAAGCEDGSVKLYRISDEEDEKCSSGLPQLISTLPSAGNAVLSLAWLPGHHGGMEGSVIFAGVADGTIRRFDCTTAVFTATISTGTVLTTRSSASTSHRWKPTLRMTVENRGLREATKVWALEALSDGTVISGDSLGHVQIWDGLSGTMSQTFNHNESGADVLCLALSEDENKVFASGVDSRVICIERQQGNVVQSNSKNASFEPPVMRKWINTGALRQHTHDVKALVVCHKHVRNNSDYLELLVSGGVDTKLCTYVAKDFKSSRPKIWYNWPMLSPVSISRKRRLLCVARAKQIDIYQLDCSIDVKLQSVLDPIVKDETKCHVKTISIQSSFNLNCATISDDGNFLAASDAASTYLFSLGIEEKNGVINLDPTKLNLPSGFKRPSVALKFDWQKRLYCASIDGSIAVLGMPPTSNEKVTLDHVFKNHSCRLPNKSHHFPFVFLDITSDGNWLAAGRFSSGKGAVHIFALPSSEAGNYQHWWSVPEMEATVNCIKLLGGGSAESSLAIGCSNNTFYIFNVIRRSLSDFSHEMGLPILSSLPSELTSRPEPITSIISNPSNLYKFILVARGYFCVVDLHKSVPEHSNWYPSNHLRVKRQVSDDESTLTHHWTTRKRSLSFSHDDHINDFSKKSNNFTICLRYSNILFQEFVSEKEMVIVEEPWMSALEELPDALARRVYGA